ncbi:YihY/virulence factor BrkB family protein [uncultured Microbacterium sp.]|uniref:YihY/virulence factor BrkB family protein n=1 Tax=uncultured Microbacterium sp. TaxID=191216 RepID=UPI0025D10142|nr:YihY/virulence factor BrkB family protein [uncultured Microbacterium sp.]
MAESESELRARLEAPIERAAALTRRTMRAFPIRVWRRFLQRNGFLLSAGMSYQGLFAVFGLLYIAFASAGLWLGGSTRAIAVLTAIANSYIPGIVSDKGLVHPDDVQSLASDASSVLSITGIVAALVVAWTGVTAVTFTRRAVRDIFGLPYDNRSFVLLKLRDGAAGALFGLALLIGSVLGFAGVWALRQIFDLLGWHPGATLFDLLTRAASVVVMFAIDSAAIALLVRFLTGTRLAWRTILPGAMLGGGAIVVLQLGAGLLLTHTPGNPLLATFAVVVAMLLWCRWVSVVILVAAAWIALTAEDRDQPLQEVDEDAARRAELAALVLAADVRLRRAEHAYETAPWWRRRSTARELRSAREEWGDALADEAAATPPTQEEGLLGLFLEGPRRGAARPSVPDPVAPPARSALGRRARRGSGDVGGPR